MCLLRTKCERCRQTNCSRYGRTLAVNANAGYGLSENYNGNMTNDNALWRRENTGMWHGNELIIGDWQDGTNYGGPYDINNLG